MPERQQARRRSEVRQIPSRKQRRENDRAQISDSVTRIMLQMEYEPEGPMEKMGDAMGAVRMQARSSLQRFKELL